MISKYLCNRFHRFVIFKTKSIKIKVETKPSTLKDIAKALGMSTSTVSRALNDSYEINEKTKKMVVEYAKSVNYRPNPIALSLKENKSWSIGVVVPEVANNFFSMAINGIEDEANGRGYQVVICQSHESLEKEIDNVRHLATRKIDGLLISLSGKTNGIEHVMQYSRDPYSVVFFDRVPEFGTYHRVVSDNFKGAYDATEYLIKTLGISKIAHITSPPSLSITRERLEGYEEALIKNGIEVDPKLIKFCGFDPEEAYQTMNQLISELQPEAFFVASDRLALNCYEAFLKNKPYSKKPVPFLGFTNLSVSHLFNPKILTVVQPAYEIGRNAARILIDSIESKKKNKEFENIILETKLKIE